MFKGWPDESLRIFLQHALADRPDGKVELKCPPEVEARFYVAPIDTDVLGASSCFKCPLMLVWGKAADRFSLAIPMVASFTETTKCRTAQVPGGHFSIMQYPQEVAEVILEFGRCIGLAR